jgi:hypothetical protein
MLHVIKWFGQTLRKLQMVAEYPGTLRAYGFLVYTYHYPVTWVVIHFLTIVNIRYMFRPKWSSSGARIGFINGSCKTSSSATESSLCWHCAVGMHVFSFTVCWQNLLLAEVRGKLYL